MPTGCPTLAVGSGQASLSLSGVNELVALDLPPGEGFVSEMVRAFDGGDAVLPLDPRLSEPARARLIGSMNPGLLVAPSGERHRLEGGLPVEPGDAVVMATSGSTGEPKGVVLTHGALQASAEATNRWLATDPAADLFWANLPLAHIGGLAVVLRAIVSGAAVTISPFSVDSAREVLLAGATITSLVPTTLGRLEAEVAAGFRWIVLGGQAPPSDLPHNVVTTYGMTETGSGVVYNGRPLEGVSVSVDPDSSEILLAGPMLLRTYRNGPDPKRTDGWFPTGDAGELVDGVLSVRGRLGDLVISGGENVWPAALEPLLERHPAVREAAVGGRPDEEWGERVTAYVVLERELEASVLLTELRQLVREELAAYAAPRAVVIVSHLPRSGIGKLRREGLQFLEGPSASV